MSRSPLSYPMHRGETDAGGAADLQTDIMRFMAILALCLVAIFALVQSIPLVPEAPSQSPAAAAPPPVARAIEPEPAPQPQSVPETRAETPQPMPLALPRPSPAAAPRQPAAPPAEETPDEGFTLRFESDHALTRLVAAGKVGLYAMTGGRARRMTVRDSRISFWDASAPNSFHEMEAGTVPRPVVDALSRTGVNTTTVGWGVTLPGTLEKRLDSLMRGNSGGTLVIGGDGELRLEAS